MNDPGLDGPAQRAAEDVEENVHEADKEKAEAEEGDFLDPVRNSPVRSRYVLDIGDSYLTPHF
jgi:hypothetical protein